jgi:hypothetical protein
MRPRGLTVGHRDRRNPRCGFELINVAANFPDWRIVNRDAEASTPSWPACPGHPRLGASQKQDVDARHKAGHDDRDFRRAVISSDENASKRITAVDNLMTAR